MEWSGNTVNPERVIVLSHGLNTSQRYFEEVEKFLDLKKSAILRVVLSGHHQVGERIADGLGDAWTREMNQAIEFGTEKARAVGAEICFFGFSLSSVVFLATFPDKMRHLNAVLLMSPPLEMTWGHYLIHLVARMGVPKLPSFNESSMRVWSWLPMKMYRALFDLIDTVGSLDPSQFPPRVVMLMDPKDRMVSFKRNVRWIETRGLNWKISAVPCSGPWGGPDRGMHHFLCREDRLDPQSRERLNAAIKEVFSSRAP